MLLTLVFITVLKTVTIVESSIFSPHRSSYLPPTFRRNSCYPLNAQLSKNIQSAACKPRETMVELFSNVSSVMIFPNKIPVKRCNGGICYGHAACLPIEKRQVQYAVRKHDFSTMKEFCEIVDVEEHTRCRCGCSVMQHHCNNHQEYRPKECMCVCTNTEEKETCFEQGRLWDDKTCTCECLESHTECSTGTEWIPSKCQCMRTVTDYYENAYNESTEDAL